MERPNVLFLVLDSARKDRLSTYGHDRETTPTLDELAATATVYEHAYTPTPWTLPSHCSMFSGLYPTEHGITNGFKGDNLRLSPDIPTLAERLSEQGYDTAGFSNNPWVGALSGLTRGFDEFVEWDLQITRQKRASIHERRDELYSRFHTLIGHASRQPAFVLKRPFFTSNLVTRAKRWLHETATTDAPSFTFLNLMEAHSPYFPPDDAFEELGLDAPGPIEPRLLNTRLLAYVLGQSDLSADQRERVFEYYDACLRYQDREVERLLDTLKRNGIFDETLVICCADHGKTLGDISRDAMPPHYLRAHNTDVPLLVKRPHQQESERVTEPAELTQLFDVIVRQPNQPTESLCANEYALLEDFIPHTGSTRQESTRWRMLCTPQKRYIQSEDGREFLLDSDGIELPAEEATALREALHRRVQALSASQEEEQSATEIDASVEAQLSDLGYFD